MMSTHKLTVTTCDQCEERVEIRENPLGGVKLAGWFQVHRLSRGMIEGDTDWDFCSEKCLAEFFGEEASDAKEGHDAQLG